MAAKKTTHDDSMTLGGLVNALRQRNGWTLRQLSAMVGIPLSTLAKVESNKLSLNYEKLQQFTSKLGLTMAEFLAGGQGGNAAPAEPHVGVMGRRSVTEASNTLRVSTPNYDYDYLCSDLREKRMVPILVRITGHTLAEFGELVVHEGEEFVMVLEGAIEVHTQFYTPVVVPQGKGIYIDSTMAHAYLAKDCESALVLAVCSGEDPALQTELMKLAADYGRETIAI
jgi:transcriptional regulator with XRE-family HTH domain